MKIDMYHDFISLEDFRFTFIGFQVARAEDKVWHWHIHFLGLGLGIIFN